jgi:cytochrome d ubiquinol oxidase subunit II
VSPELLVAGVLLAALVLYALGGGADFGGGVWDLLALGSTGARQRGVIAHAIAPIWEANHVWLILVVVLLFVCFPLAFAAIGTALHIPLTLMLIGIILRGAAFTFRTYDRQDRTTGHRWSRVFAIASVVTPVMLGVCVGAVLSGRLRVDVATGRMTTNYVSEWLAPFPFALGLFALALFAFLAATYLTLETREDDLRRAFRARALGAAVATGVLAFACLLIAREGAPRMHAGLAGRDWSPAFQIVTGVVAIGAIAALATWRFKLARVLAALQVTLVIAGWGFSQFPYLVEPDLTIANSAAPPRVLRAVLWALAAGALLLLPALAFLYRLFKGGPPEPTGAE